jgi:hypothetical protein
MTGPIDAHGQMVPVDIEFRAPGDRTPIAPPVETAAGTLRTPTSPLFVAPDIHTSPEAVKRQRFLATITDDDADIRVVATALRLRGYSVKTIATGLDVSAERVRRVLRQARQDGNLHDVLADLTTEALPLAVEKLIEAIGEGQVWAISDTLKGLGAFRTHQAHDGVTVRDERKLEVNFVIPAAAMAAVNPRGIVGAPREVVDAAVHTGGQQEAATLGAQSDREAGVG